MIHKAIDDYLHNQQPKPGQEWFWTKAWQQSEREVETELAAGNYETFDTIDEFLKTLEQGSGYMKSCTGNHK